MPTDLEPGQFNDFARDHPLWVRDGESISRTFVFGDFSQAVGFVVRVALAADVADHHPDIDIRWSKVTIVLSTHSEAALTTKDLDLAHQIDGF
ncbi:MAG: 4a-hydroxytetrahydrobiopterin dehydratase [Actinomycetota bacterium]